MDKVRRRTGQRFRRLPVHIHQCPFQVFVVYPCMWDVILVKSRIVLLEPFQPPVQLAKYMFQPFGEILPVPPHPNSTKFLPNYHLRPGAK